MSVAKGSNFVLVIVMKVSAKITSVTLPKTMAPGYGVTITPRCRLITLIFAIVFAPVIRS